VRGRGKAASRRWDSGASRIGERKRPRREVGYRRDEWTGDNERKRRRTSVGSASASFRPLEFAASWWSGAGAGAGVGGAAVGAAVGAVGASIDSRGGLSSSDVSPSWGWTIGAR
jgi:hypothetical protein